MAASDVERLISTIFQKKKKQTLHSSDFQTALQDYNISITILARKTHNMRSKNA